MAVSATRVGDENRLIVIPGRNEDLYRTKMGDNNPGCSGMVGNYVIGIIR